MAPNIGEDSELAKQKRLVEWGVSYSAAVGYGFWQSAVKTTNT